MADWSDWWVLVLTALVAAGCSSAGSSGEIQKPGDEAEFRQMRETMVQVQIEQRGVKTSRVLEALRKVPRHLFVPGDLVERAYEDRALPIGDDQTISQPYIVALMTELLEPDRNDRVLEIGTGSGYQAAILAELVGHVYTIEIVEPLARQATDRLAAMGYNNITVRTGDGYRGWVEHAPFDAVIVTAAPDHVPQPLVDQLKEGGKLVIPVGDKEQYLMLLVKGPSGLQKQRVIPVRFVPMTGEAQSR